MGKELDKDRDTASSQQQPPTPHDGPSPGSTSKSSGLTAPKNPVQSGLVAAPVEAPQRRAEPSVKPSPDSNVDWSAVWADNKLNLVRHVLEPTRMIPGLGLLTGWSADLIEGAQNKDSLKDVEQTNQGARFQQALAIRQGLVVFNNTLGHVRYLGTLGQDAAIASVVGSWLAPFTGEVNEVLNAVNLGTNGLQFYLDTGIAVAARMEQSKHDPDSKAYAAYHGLWQNFAVNGVTDAVGMLLDIADLATGSLANASVIKQVKGAITATTKSASYMKLQLLPLIKNWVGVWGPSVWKAFEGGYKKKPEATGEVGPHGVSRGVAGKIMMNEIAEIQSTYRFGDPLVRHALDLPGQTSRDLGRVVQQVGGAKEPFIWLRNKLAAGIKDGSARVSKMLEMTTTASSAERAARKASTVIDTAVTAVGRLHMPAIAAPEKTNLGDGALAKGAGKIVDGAKNLGAGAVAAATQKIQSAIDAAKQPIVQQATAIKSELAWSVEFTAELQRTLNEQTAKFREQGAQFSAQLARCRNVDDVFKMLFGLGAKVMGAPEFSVDQLQLDWLDIRTAIDQGAGVAREVASGGGGDQTAPMPPAQPGPIRRKARDDGAPAPAADSAITAASSSSGFALPDALRRKFESSLGTDLSGVQLHTGAASGVAADAVAARAYTIGQDIHFAPGQYDPGSARGEHLIAHEVAHTVQQRGGTPTRQHKLEVSAPGDALEVAADRAADAMVVGRSAEIVSASERQVQRKETGRPAPTMQQRYKAVGVPTGTGIGQFDRVEYDSDLETLTITVRAKFNFKPFDRESYPLEVRRDPRLIAQAHREHQESIAAFQASFVQQAERWGGKHVFWCQEPGLESKRATTRVDVEIVDDKEVNGSQAPYTPVTVADHGQEHRDTVAHKAASMNLDMMSGTKRTYDPGEQRMKVVPVTVPNDLRRTGETGSKPDPLHAPRGLSEPAAAPEKEQYVISHELGHRFGLGDEYADAGEPMYAMGLPTEHSKLAKEKLGTHVTHGGHRGSVMAGGNDILPQHGVTFLSALERVTNMKWGFERQTPQKTD